MSKTDHWMPLYVGDFLADTMHLSVSESGAYLLLLMHYWRAGPLPDDDRKLAGIARCQPREWRKVSLTVRGFFTVENNTLRQKRMDEERLRHADVMEAKRRGGKARWGKDTSSTPDAEPSPSTSTTHAHAEHMLSTASCDAKLRTQPQPDTQKEKEERPPLVSPPQAKPRAARGTRLPTDWEPSDDDRGFAIDHQLDPDLVAECFRDFWHSKAGANASKLNWSATWRNWCRREAERKRPPKQEFRNGFLEIAQDLAQGKELPKPSDPVTLFLEGFKNVH